MKPTSRSPESWCWWNKIWSALKRRSSLAKGLFCWSSFWLTKICRSLNNQLIGIAADRSIGVTFMKVSPYRSCAIGAEADKQTIEDKSGGFAYLQACARVSNQRNDFPTLQWRLCPDHTGNGWDKPPQNATTFSAKLNTFIALAVNEAIWFNCINKHYKWNWYFSIAVQLVGLCEGWRMYQ